MKKRIISMLVVMAVFISIFSTSIFVNAAESQEHTVDTSSPHLVLSGKENTNNVIHVNLKLSDEMKNESLSALKVTMDVDVKSGNFTDADIQFSVEEQLKKNAAITSVSYNNGKLVVYIASASALFTSEQFQSDNNILLGELSFKVDNQDFDVTVTPTSFTYVNQNETMDKTAQLDCADYHLSNTTYPEPDPNPDNPGGETTIPTPKVELTTPLGVILSEDSNKILAESITKYLNENFKDVLATLPDGYTLEAAISFNELSEADINADTMKLINDSLAENTKIGRYYDINISVSALLNGSVLPELNGVKISTTTEGLSFTVTIPDDLKKDFREYGMIRVHDGRLEETASTTNSSNGTLTFTSDKYSVFAMTYRDLADGKTPSDSTDSRDSMINAKTGDSNGFVLPLILAASASIILLAVLIVVGKKKKQN